MEGKWEWITSESWAYSNWAGGEPNNCSGIEHYLVYFTLLDGLASSWNDLGSGENGGYGCGGCFDEWYPMSMICEWDSKTLKKDNKKSHHDKEYHKKRESTLQRLPR